MSDRFKFRIWLPDAKINYGGYEGHMYYQGNQYLQSFFRRICNHYYEGHPAALPFEIEERLEQCTGLKDKNGKLIYGGDIVRSLVCFGPGGQDYRNYAVVMDEFGHNLVEWLWLEEQLPEVLGNIHENPELLT